MRIRRDISSIPERSASETWQRIVELVTGSGSKDVQQLKAAAGVMASIITDEHPSARPIIVEGVGPQLRIYCSYGMNAIEQDNKVDSLNWNPTDGNWTMNVPCDADNMDWVKKSLAGTSPRIKVFDVDADERADDEEQKTSGQSEIVVDWNFGGKP
jgi:hypothetical protein